MCSVQQHDAAATLHLPDRLLLNHTHNVSEGSVHSFHSEGLVPAGTARRQCVAWSRGHRPSSPSPPTTLSFPPSAPGPLLHSPRPTPSPYPTFPATNRPATPHHQHSPHTTPLHKAYQPNSKNWPHDTVLTSTQNPEVNSSILTFVARCGNETALGGGREVIHWVRGRLWTGGRIPNPISVLSFKQPQDSSRRKEGPSTIRR